MNAAAVHVAGIPLHVIRLGIVHHAAIVPNDSVSDLPFVTLNKFRLQTGLEKGI